MKEVEKDGASDIYEGEENAHRVLMDKYERKDHLEDLRIDGRIM